MTEPENSAAAAAAVAAAVTASKKKHEEDQQRQQGEDTLGGATTTNSNNPILSFFLNMFQLLPLPKKKKPEPIVSDSDRPIKRVDNSDKPEPESKPTVVAFPRQELPSLKLEYEDSDTNTNPMLLWQVYAIGGFFILGWAWSRWKERRGGKKPSDEEPPPDHE